MTDKPTILFFQLIYPGYSSFNAGDYGMQLKFDLVPHKHAVAALVAWLRENGCEGHYIWIDPNDEDGISKIEEKIAECNPHAIGMSVCTDEMVLHYRTLEKLKEMHPEIPTIVGGPHVTPLPEHTLEHFPAIDYITIGEGEITLTEWLKKIASGQGKSGLRETYGLAFRDESGEIVITPPRERIPDINILPTPANDLIIDPDTPPDQSWAFPLVCSYGCYFECTFCSSLQGKMRAFKPAKVVDRIEWAQKKYGVKYFGIPDSLWPPSIPWMNEFCDLIEERGLKIKFHFLARAGILKEKHLRRLKQLGAEVVMVGVEAGHPDILKSIKKKITVEMAQRSFDALNKVGIFTVAFFIFGNQGENRETIQASIDLSHKLNSTLAFFRALGPLPGSEAFDFVPDDKKDWWMQGGDVPDWWMRGTPPSICDLPPNELELLSREVFLRYPLRWAYLRQHVLGGELPPEFRSIARRIYLYHLRKYFLGISERFWLTRKLIRAAKRVLRR